MFLDLNKFLLSCVVAFSISGCLKDAPVIPTTPSWYFENKQNTSLFLYGVGEGSSLVDAKLMALNSISSSIIVTLSGEVTKKTKVSNDNYSKELTSDLKMELSKITFADSIIEKKEVSANKYYVLIKVNKLELIKTISKELQILDNSLQQQYLSVAVLPKLEAIYSLKQIVAKSKNTTNQVNILSSLDSNFESKSYLDRYEKYSSELNTAKSALNITVASNESIFGDFVIAYLNANGYKQNQKTSDVKIDINNKPRFSMASGWHIAKVSTNIKVTSNEKVINSFTIETIGRSFSTDQNALVDAANKFKVEIESKGIDYILFQK